MNNLTLTGNITKDIETKKTSNGTMAMFTLAWNKKDQAHFFDCLAFDKKADILSTYCKKGDKILIRGELNQDKWTAQDGTTRTSVKIIVQELEFLTKRDAEEKEETVEEKPLDGEIPF